MGLADDLAEIECPACYRLAIEALCDAIDLEQISQLQAQDPEQALELRESLKQLLDQPDLTLDRLVDLLVAKVRERYRH